MVWRDPPRDNKCLGSVARNSEPLISQVFVVPAREDMEPRELEKKMFILRKIATHTIPQAGVRFYISSLSTRTIVYKGQFDPCQVNGIMVGGISCCVFMAVNRLAYKLLICSCGSIMLI